MQENIIVLEELRKRITELEQIAISIQDLKVVELIELQVIRLKVEFCQNSEHGDYYGHEIVDDRCIICDLKLKELDHFQYSLNKDKEIAEYNWTDNNN